MGRGWTIPAWTTRPKQVRFTSEETHMCGPKVVKNELEKRSERRRVHGKDGTNVGLHTC